MCIYPDISHKKFAEATKRVPEWWRGTMRKRKKSDDNESGPGSVGVFAVPVTPASTNDNGEPGSVGWGFRRLWSASLHPGIRHKRLSGVSGLSNRGIPNFRQRGRAARCRAFRRSDRRAMPHKMSEFFSQIGCLGNWDSDSSMKVQLARPHIPSVFLLLLVVNK